MKFPTKIPFTYRNIRLRIKAAITKQELIWYVWFNRYDGSDPEFILGLPCDDFIDNGMIRNGAELGSIVTDRFIRWIYVDPIKQLEMYMKYPETYAGRRK